LFIKNQIIDNKIQQDESFDLLKLTDQCINFINEHYSPKSKQRQFDLYALFNVASSVQEVKVLMADIDKLKPKKIVNQ